MRKFILLQLIAIICCFTFSGCCTVSRSFELAEFSTISGADLANGLVILNESKLVSSVTNTDNSALTMTFENGDVLTYTVDISASPTKISCTVVYISSSEFTPEDVCKIIHVLTDYMGDGVETYLTDKQVQAISDAVINRDTMTCDINMSEEAVGTLKVSYDGTCLNISIEGVVE